MNLLRDSNQQTEDYSLAEDLVDILRDNYQIKHDTVEHLFNQRHNQTLNHIKEIVYTLLKIEYTKQDKNWDEGMFNFVLEEKISLKKFIGLIREARHEFNRYQRNEIELINYFSQIKRIYKKYDIPC